MKRIACIVMVIFVGMFFFTVHCTSAENPKYGGKLVVGQDIDAVGLDPYKSTAMASWNFYEQIYNTLLEFDNQGNLQPSLAVSWESSDPQTYVFHLRKGVKFHDGKDFGAEDVKATFDRMMDPKTASIRAKQFKLVDRVEIVDQYTVRFILKSPYGPFLNFLAAKQYSAIQSKYLIDKGVDFNTVVIGTGPFQLVKYTPNDKMLLKKNPLYWEKGLPYLDEIEIRLIKDAASRVAALRSKSVDYTWLIEPQLVKILMKEKGIQSATTPATANKRLYLNCTKAPLDNVQVRRALSMATDRKSILQVAVLGKGELSGPIPPAAGDFALSPEKLSYYTYDPEGAKKLLAKAGYPKGLKLTIKVSAIHVIDQYIVQMLQRQWEKSGVEVQILQEEWGTILRDWESLNYQIIHITDIWRPDPDEYVSYLNTKSRTGFQDPGIEKLVMDGLTTVDREKRVTIYHEIEKKLTEDAPILYIFARPQRFEFWHDYVKGYSPTPMTERTAFKNTWLSK